jgi:pantoate--beta-alanine ligase
MLNLVGPASVYLGQRHAQQVVILRRMMRDLFMNIELVVCPTVRRPTAWLLSSANAALDRRGMPPLPFAALNAARAAYDAGERSAEVLQARMPGRRRIDGAPRLHQRRRRGQPVELQRSPAPHCAGGGLDRAHAADR